MKLLTSQSTMAASFVVTLAALAATGLAQSITSIGVVPGGNRSSATGLSGDGNVVSAWSNGPLSPRAYRWTNGGGFQDLGAATSSVPYGVNSDGSVLVGTNSVGSNPRAFRWTSSGGLQLLPSETSNAYAVSGDGNVVVGDTWDGAFRWTPTTGVQLLGILPGMHDSKAKAVSADGSVVAGYSSRQDGSISVYRAFRWTEEEGIQSLGGLPGYFGSLALGVSADGSTIVGSSWNPQGYQRIVRWDHGVIRDIGVPLGFDLAGGSATNADGSVIVGGARESISNPIAVNRAVIWTEALGVRTLHDYLPTLGIDLTGWQLEHSTGISADGRVIVGFGLYNGQERGWVVNIPSPGVGGIVAGTMLWCAALRRRVSRAGSMPL